MTHAALVVVVLAVALLAGCGNDDGTIYTDRPSSDTPIICGPSGCSDATPTRTPGDNDLHKSCPVTPGETVVIDGTPYVVFARACTRTPTPIP